MRVHLTMRSLAALAATLTVVACGGGGGDAPATPPASGGPTEAALQNEYDAPTVSLEAGDAVVQWAQLARGAILAMRSSPRSLSMACSSGQGSVNYVWSDADANARWSAGDSFTAHYSGCKVPRINSVVNGSFSGRMLATPGPDLDQWSIALQTSAPMSLGTLGRSVHGAVGVTFDTTNFRARLSVTPGAPDQISVTTRWGQSAVVTSPRSSVELEYDNARSLVRLDFTMDSALVGGRVRVETLTPFTTAVRADLSPLGRKRPTAGELHVVGANADKVVVKAADGGFTQQLFRGTSAAALGAQLWGVAGIGDALWWIGPELADDAPSLIDSYGVDGFCVWVCSDVAYTTHVSGRPWMRVFFPWPVTRSADQEVQLVDVGAYPDTGTLDAKGTVAAEVVFAGAALAVRPAQELERGRRFALRTTQGTISDPTGGVTRGLSDLVLFATSPP